MSQSKPTVTIEQAFREFLAEQEARLSPATVSKYESILDLFGSCLERYWPGHDEEYERITATGGTFCGTFGPEEILGGLSEFLGYFMPHKVIASKATMQAAGTVTKKLVKWLAQKGYVKDDEGLQAAEERATARPVTCPPVKTWWISWRRTWTKCAGTPFAGVGGPFHGHAGRAGQALA